MKLAKIRRYQIRKFFNLASDIAPKMPSWDDSLLTKIVKGISIMDSVQEAITGDSNFETSRYLNGVDVTPITNEAFVALFETGTFEGLFTIIETRMRYNVLVEARHPELGSIYLVRDMDRYHSPIWYNKNFDFAKLLDYVWVRNSNRAALSTSIVSKSQQTLKLRPIPEPKLDFFGKAKQYLQDFQDQHQRYRKDGVPRTYLFCGKQGMGKTTYLSYLAYLNNDRFLRIDANDLTHMPSSRLEFLLTNLAPDFLLIDDIDRASNLKESLPGLFTLLIDLKSKCPKLTVGITANDINALDPALLRPERIDEIIELDPPDCDEREDILKGYIAKFGVTQEVDTRKIAELTESLTAAYLQEIALQLKYRPQEKVIKTVARMIELSKGREAE